MLDRDDERVLINLMPFAVLIGSGFLWYLLLGTIGGF